MFINGLVQDCGISSADALEIPQSSTNTTDAKKVNFNSFRPSDTYVSVI